MMTENEKGIFDIITKNLINERLDKTILNNAEYIKIQKKKSECYKKFERLNLVHNERIIIDRLICANTECGSCYGELMYKQGFYDCVSLFKELGLIKTS
ncbi:MAG: hypothetical protein J1E98_13520 [Lachnospiraceae bacterium]|nr:hypothetical protein [Lachnospiraceae bacterium]